MGTLAYTHRHGQVGPDSRPHEHFTAYRVSALLPPGKPAEQEAYASAFALAAREEADRISGHDLDAFPGIAPSPQGIATYLREQLLLRYPTLELRLDGEDYGVEVP